MPPRKIKKDPKAVKIGESIEEPLMRKLGEMQDQLREIAVSTNNIDVERILALIPKELRKMNFLEFMNGPPRTLFPVKDEIETEKGEEEEGEEEEEEEQTQSAEVLEVEEEHEPANESASKEQEQQIEDEMEIDDAARETSIPIAPSEHNSFRNTATDAMRHELITPAGHVLAVPQTIHPKIDGPAAKAFRLPYSNEEIAFSLNGSPMVLQGKKALSQDEKRREAARQGLLEPKIEDEENIGTSV
ncbi:unnamed protein product [Caenorhabditis sp. 36 PRJEB53466]|nr:unnamed protein product [Caenorhabditis sp. 36 PRJEB53466]